MGTRRYTAEDYDGAKRLVLQVFDDAGHRDFVQGVIAQGADAERRAARLEAALRDVARTVGRCTLYGPADEAREVLRKALELADAEVSAALAAPETAHRKEPTDGE